MTFEELNELVVLWCASRASTANSTRDVPERARFGLSGKEEGMGIQMAPTADDRRRHGIECPVCQAHGPLLRHDIRGSLVYFCQRCQHEWQIDPAEEPLEV